MMSPRATSADMASVQSVITAASSAAATSPKKNTKKQEVNKQRLHTMLSNTVVKTPGTPSSHRINQKATDDTLSTANCDDSLTTPSVNMSGTRLYSAPPVLAVNVDKRSVRQRLRDQEAKIAALLQSKSISPTSSEPNSRPPTPKEGATDEVLLKLVQALESDLKKVEAEKTVLKDKLTRVEKQQAAIDEDEDIDSMKDLEVVDKTSVATSTKPNEEAAVLKEQMAVLQLELRRKTHETLLLQDRWETTLQRMVQYQLDLETHDLHYTDYAATQQQAGDKALKELKELTRKDQPPETRKLGKQAKQMMSTLLKDLEVMGERYQESRVNQEQQLAHWKQQQLEWKHRAEMLEATLKEHKVAVPDKVPEVVVQNPSKSERSVHIHLDKSRASQEDLVAQAQAAKQEAEFVQLQKSVLQEEVTRLQATVSQLQSVTQQQQDTLQEAAAAAAAAVADSKKQKKKKRKSWNPFAKKKKDDDSSSSSTPTPPVVIPPPLVNISAALAPMQEESQRFDRFQEQLQIQSDAFTKLRQDYQKQAKQKAQLQQTVTELRMEQIVNVANEENRALNDLQALFDDLQTQRRKEQLVAQAEVEQMRAQLQALTGNANSSSNSINKKEKKPQSLKSPKSPTKKKESKSPTKKDKSPSKEKKPTKK